jgi:hypothetical protein
MRSVLLVSAVLSFISATAGGTGFETPIGDEKLTLVLPAGMCRIEAEKSSDANYINAVESSLAGTNRLLGAFADCQQLTDWRSGNKMFLDNHGQYQAPAAMLDTVAPPGVVAEICSELRRQGEKVLDGMKDDLTDRMERAVKGLQVNELRSLGVVGEDPGACYSAALQNLRVEGGPEKLQHLVFAITVVKGKLLFLYVYGLHTGDHTIPALLDRVRTTVGELAKANEK